MNLFAQLDERATKKRVRSVLEQYRTLKRIAKEPFNSQVTAVYSFEPRSYTGGVSKPIEKHIVRQQAAVREIGFIEEGLSHMENPEQRRILYEKYFDWAQKSDISIYMDIEMSETEFYREVEKALFAYAEVYKSGALLQFKNEASFEDWFGELFE